MSSEYIHVLLKRYWNCETTVQEERELQSFFSGSGVPESLEKYTPLFSYIREEQLITPGEEFNLKLESAIRIEEDKKEKKRYVAVPVFAPYLRIAASVLLIGVLGVSIYSISRQNNPSYFVETYQDPGAAMKHATFALEKISDAIQASEKASRKTIQRIDELDIDWSTLNLTNESALY